MHFVPEADCSVCLSMPQGSLRVALVNTGTCETPGRKSQILRWASNAVKSWIWISLVR
jgi:hypothetical protein